MDEDTEEVLAMAEESLNILDDFISDSDDDVEFQTFEVDAITEIHAAAVKLKK